MNDIMAVRSWLEGLAQDDWADFHSDSEVQEIAKAALELLQEQAKHDEQKEILKMSAY